MKFDISLEGLSVAVGMPTSRDLNPLVVKSLLETSSLCMRFGVSFQLVMVAGNAVLQWARDEVAYLFLTSEANRLFWIDSDISWEPNDFMRMLALSQEYEVVSATYPAKKDTPTFYVDRDEYMQCNQHGLVEIHGCGLGFTVVHRKVIEELTQKAPKIYDEITAREMASIFRFDSRNGKRLGEDMAFFNDIRELGYNVWLDTSVNLGHIGGKVYSGHIHDCLFPKGDL